MESAFRDDDGTVYGWFHNEVPYQCPPWPDNTPGYPIVVKIGALRSKDNGANWKDLGFVMEGSAASIRL